MTRAEFLDMTIHDLIMISDDLVEAMTTPRYVKVLRDNAAHIAAVRDNLTAILSVRTILPVQPDAAKAEAKH